ncbi:MAG: winged helix-turn-helix transcriptional regulator [Streptosporangiaceae bacterium]
MGIPVVAPSGEISFDNHWFDQISEYGAARDILTDRLSSLVEAGVICRMRHQDHPPGYEYHLTTAGTACAQS